MGRWAIPVAVVVVRCRGVEGGREEVTRRENNERFFFFLKMWEGGGLGAEDGSLGLVAEDGTGGGKGHDEK